MPMMDYESRVKNHLEGIEEAETHQKNKELFKSFNRFLHAKDHSSAHIDKLLNELKIMMKEFEFNFEEASREDLEEIVGWVNQRDVSDSTKRQYKITLKKFYKWINGGEYPDKVKWFNTTQQRRKKKLPENLLEEKDIMKLLKASTDARDKAFISILWETGARMGEIHSLKVGSVENTENGMKVTINGKTGPRRLTLIECVPYVNTWINAHPRGDEKKAPLWVNVGNTNKGKKAGYRALTKMLKVTAKRAGVDKPVNPHHFRHSRATYLANKFTEPQMCEWFGWKQGSDMPAKYVHLSGRDLDKSYKKLHGIVEEEEEESDLTPVECQRCRNENPHDARLCNYCGQPFSQEVLREVEETEEDLIESSTQHQLLKAFELMKNIDSSEMDKMLELLEGD